MNIKEIKIPEGNSLKNEIKEIVGLCEELKEEYNSVFNRPATDDEIEEWESNNCVKLPESYKDWLRFSNGSIIRGMLAKLYGLDNIMVSTNEFSEDYVVIGELFGDGSKLCFLKSTGEFVWHNYTKNRKYVHFNKILNKIMNIM